jgi:hypothetical protein
MLHIRLLAAVCAMLAVSPIDARAQVSAADQAQATAEPPAPSPSPETPRPVAVTALAAPDLFSAGGRNTGLGPDLWKGASPAVFRSVLPLLSSKALSPAGRALARRVMATGASAPESVGRDAVLAGQRIDALIALGGLGEANAILAKTSGLDRDPGLAQAAAESALLSGDPDRACAVAAGLADGRGEIYWLRLRAYCQLRRGETGPAQLTFDLAQGQSRDVVYGRLMGARLAGAGDPGKASLRNGLDYGLSRDLGLDLAAAAPSPAVAAALRPDAPVEAVWPPAVGPGGARAVLAALAVGDLPKAQALRAARTPDGDGGAGDIAVMDWAVADAALAVASGQGLGPALDALIEHGGAADVRSRIRAQTAGLLLVASGAPAGDAARGALAGFTLADTRAPAARGLMMEAAAADHRTGETALLALWSAAEAGAAGPAAGDRARIVRALHACGLEADARAFALEGLLALR